MYLETKLRAPRLSAALLERHRLSRRLDEALERGCQLIVLSAPAGYGKTTLCAQWGAALEQPLAWLGLDTSDDEPQRFFEGLVRACCRALPRLSEQLLLDWVKCGDLYASMTALINTLDRDGDRLVLVIDDLHVLTHREIRSTLRELLPHLSEAATVLIATREDPPLAMSALRGRGELAELRSTDLSFTLDEGERFLEDTMGLRSSSETTKLLWHGIEGWPAGLQLAALACGIGDRIDDAGARSAGEHRLMTDYLADEVLAKLSRDTVELLTSLSFLEQFTADLCTHLTGQLDTASCFRDLESKNLFIERLDGRLDGDVTYRLHGVLRDHLRRRLERRGPGVTAELEDKASRWFEERRLWIHALQHGIRAGRELDGVIAKVAPEMLRSGEIPTVESWLASIDTKHLLRQPGLAIVKAWTHYFRGQSHEVKRCLRAMDDCGSELPVWIESQVDLLTSWLHRIAHRHDESTALSLSVLRNIESSPKPDPYSHAIAQHFVACSLREGGRIDQAIVAFARSIRLSFDCGAASPAMGGAYMRAKLLQGQGRLSAAERCLRSAIERAEEKGLGLQAASAQLHTGLAEVHLDRCEYQDAREQLDRADALVPRGLPLFIGLAAAARARLERLCGSPSAIASALSGTEGLDLDWRSSPDQGELLLEQGLDTLARCRRPSAVTLKTADMEASTLDLAAETRLMTWLEISVRAHTMGVEAPAEDDVVAAAALLEKHCREHERLGVLVNVQVLRSIVERSSDPTEADALLLEAVELAASERMLMPFVSRGAEVIPELVRLSTRTNLPAPASFLTDLSRLHEKRDSGPAPRRAQRSEEPHLIEEPSRRELDVLTLMAEGLSNKEIAGKLHLSSETVKAHARNLYGKLGVRNRTQAAHLGRQLGLIE